MVDLDKPVVFFIASNGIGKSSLLEALRWCLLANPSATKSKRAVRAGSEQASVTVELGLADGRDLTVTRTLTKTGRPDFHAIADDEPITEEGLQEALEEMWGADSLLIDRLMFDVGAGDRTFPIRERISRLLGVDEMLAAHRALVEAAKEIGKQIAPQVKKVKALEQAEAEVIDDIEGVEASLEEARKQRVELVGQRVDLDDQVRARQTWETFRSAQSKYTSDIASLTGKIADETGQDLAPTEIERVAAETDAQLTGVRKREIQSERLRAGARSAADLLANPVEACPTCLRALSEDERSSALARHTHTVVDENEIEELRAESLSLEGRIDQFRTLAIELASIKPPEAPSIEEPAIEVVAKKELVEAELAAMDRSIGELQERQRAASENDSARNELAAAQDELKKLARSEQILETAGKAMRQSADDLIMERIDPLVEEISHRWKRVFGSDGLSLDASGQVFLRRDGQDLELQDMSGGEKASALAITRLLIASTSTQLPTLCFDEPLEHLDPQRRGATAATLVKAVQVGTVSQLIITTYEAAIARQLAASAPETVALIQAGP